MFHRIINKKVQAWQAAQMETYCREIENMYRQMRTWRHDFRNHLQVMKAHLDLGEYQELSDYLAALNEDLSQIDRVIKTGNVMLDAILNSKISLARSLEIAVNVKVILPPSRSVSDYDLCVILGNLLDNGIEGCGTVKDGEKRFLNVYIGVLKNQLYLSVTNSHGAAIRKDGGRYRSTKSPGHGLGIYSIDSIAGKYGGRVNRQHDDSVFATEILLPL